MRWVPDNRWLAEDAYIIGGGPSLATFDWSLLHPKNTIGCNSAFALGPAVCRVCYFGDEKFFRERDPETRRMFSDGLREYSEAGGLVVTDHPHAYFAGHPWVRWLPRQPRGLGTAAIGFNTNSGSAAINLALLLGAARVFLLGFDMQLGAAGTANFHKKSIEPPDARVYGKMLAAMQLVAQQLPVVFPGREVINVNDGGRLACFPRVGVAEHFSAQGAMV